MSTIPEPGASTIPGRRRLLKGLGQAGLLGLLPPWGPVLAQGRLGNTRLNEKMLVVHGPQANVLVVQSDEGLILVDGGPAPWSVDLLAMLEQSADAQPYRALINTHWHPEQTGANQVLGERGVEIIAHENTRLWLSRDVEQRWSGVLHRALPEAARPTLSLDDSSDLALGEHALHLGYLLHAHTDGDLFVHFPADKVLFTGGFLSSDTWPLIDWWTGGWTGGMLNAFDSVLEVCAEDSLIVPSSGPLMSVAELREQREMFLAIFDKVHAGFVKSLGPDEIVASRPAAGYRPDWGSADLFVRLAAQSLQGHLRGGAGGWLPRIP